MRPVLFRWRSVNVRSYPAMLYFGLIFGVLAGDVASHRAGLDPFRTYIATLLLIIPALAGARLLFVVANWNAYRDALRRIWDRREGGSIMYGGLPLALLFSVPLLRALKLNFGSFWDVSSFTILVGMIFTRVGCLLHGCCCGRRSEGPFAVVMPNGRGVWERRLPAQIFEALSAAVLLALAGVTWHSLPVPGSLFLLVVLGYSGARFVMEFGRERQPGSRLFRITHAISAVSFVSCAGTLMLYWRK
jgi:phosphatidylglycerol---prolipoprotein diacylglyceryl transferase